MLTLWNSMWITLCALVILISFSPLFSSPFPFPLLLLFERRSVRWSDEMLSSVCRTHLAKDMRYDRYVKCKYGFLFFSTHRRRRRRRRKGRGKLFMLSNYQFNWHISSNHFFVALLWISYALYSIIWGHRWMILWKDKSIKSISIWMQYL